MPTYKGNVGNLMQHWTLCELLNIAQRQDIPGLNFIDAHAMAPLARTKDSPDGRFNRAQTRVQRNCEPNHEWPSKYEWAWHHLAPSMGYPNSAVFVKKIWQRKFSLSLCEINWPTIAELGLWCDHVRNLDRCANAELFIGDWREWFAVLLLNPADAGLPPESLTLISFDPYRYDPTKDYDARNTDGGNLYPNDIVRLLDAIGNANVVSPVIIQLSTYSNNRGRASQGVVIPQIDTALTAQGFAGVIVPALNAQNNPHQSMMSLVYLRGIHDGWLEQSQALPSRFADWARAI